MKNIIGIIGLAIIFLFLGCNNKSTEPEDNITVKPIIKKTSVNYNQETLRTCLPDSASHNSMSRAYSNNYSKEVKEKLNEYIKGEVRKLGEDVNVVDIILSKTGCKNANEYILPTYLERAKYDSKDAWLIQIIYGLGVPSFGHYRCFVFDITNLDTLVSFGCR